jgi:hypothetical protein
MKALSSGKGPVIHLDESSVLDIGTCLVAGVDIAPGRAIPDDGDPRIDHSLEGFLFTCGPDHIRHPQPIAGRSDGARYPLHGSFSSNPAEILFWDAQGDADCHAQIRVSRADGGEAVLERHWRIDAETGEVWLSDRVVNTEDRPLPFFHMYHMNIGAWLFDDGVKLSGSMIEGGSLPWNFGPEPGSVFCVPAREEGEPWAEVVLGPIAALGGLSLKVRFRTDTLPYLQVWRNQKAPAHVLGIEPVSHRLASRAELEEAGEFVILHPGQSIEYGLCFSFV